MNAEMCICLTRGMIKDLEERKMVAFMKKLGLAIISIILLLLMFITVYADEQVGYVTTDYTLLYEHLNVVKVVGSITALPQTQGLKEDEIKVDEDVYKVGKVYVENLKLNDKVLLYAQNEEKTLFHIQPYDETKDEDAIEILSALGIIKGYENGEFLPESTITRAEFTAMVVRALGIDLVAEDVKGEKNYFFDVSSDHWAAGYILLAVHRGIIQGYGDRTFGPEDKITYEQAVKIVVASLGYTPLAYEKGGYPLGYLSIARDEKVIRNVEESIGTAITRSNVAQLIFNSLTVPLVEQVGYKPVIYLYPGFEQRTTVKLNLKGHLTCTYPDYKDGWNVIAKPDGTLINIEDNKQYSYLFWEGMLDNAQWDLSKGFVVKGSDTAKFLQEQLFELGLTLKEYNEFIVYWLPQMQNNKYNLITFAGKEYEDIAQLDINPKPDSMLRIFMVFKALERPIHAEPLQIKPFERKGFTVVEWGGTEIK